MTQQTGNTMQAELTSLLGNLLRNSEDLVQQQLALFKTELHQELGKVGTTAVCLGAGAACLALGGLLSPVVMVHLLHRTTGLPLWACYGLLSGGLAAVGVSLLAQGSRSAAQLEFDLPQTRQSLRENLAWLKEQLPATS